MALKKSITLYNGVVTNYHRIDYLSVQKTAENKFIINVNVSSFVNDDYRQKDIYNHVNSECFSFTVDSVPTNVYAVAYEKLKALEKFEGATNI